MRDSIAANRRERAMCPRMCRAQDVPLQGNVKARLLGRFVVPPPPDAPESLSALPPLPRAAP
eukprot:6495211-Prymnesium_polylepis.1